MGLDQERIDRFKRVAQGLHGEAHILIAQIDPDAVASAVALAYAVQSLSACTVRIFYAGEFAHPQNRAIVNKYNLKPLLTPVTELEPGQVRNCMLVDSSSTVDNRLPGGMVLDPVLVIDHHRGTDLVETKDRFFWIEDVGSASTMLAELLQALDLSLDGEQSSIASLLALGIYTDTRTLLSASRRDHDAYEFLTQSIDLQELQLMIDYPLPESHYRNLAHALTHYERRSERLVASTGTLESTSGDDLSTIADYFLRMDGISLVVIWGIIGDAVRVSARSDNLSAPLDDFLNQRFGPSAGAKLTPDGKGQGGARIRLDLGMWMSDATRTEVEAMVGRRIRELIFDKVEPREG